MPDTASQRNGKGRAAQPTTDPQPALGNKTVQKHTSVTHKYTELSQLFSTIDCVSIHVVALIEAVLIGDINQMDLIFSEVQHDIYRAVGNDTEQRAILIDSVLYKTLKDSVQLDEQPSNPKPEYERSLF